MLQLHLVTRAARALTASVTALAVLGVGLGPFGASPSVAVAQPTGGSAVDVSGAKRGAYPLAVPKAAGGDAAASAELTKIASFDFAVAGVFKVVDPAAFLADLPAEQLGIVPQKWKDVGAYGVMKHQVTVSGGDVSIEFKLYEVSKGDSPVLSKTYRGKRAEMRKLVHMWCNDVVKYYTGEPGFFGSRIAMTVKGKGKSAIYAMDFDGHGAGSVSRNDSINTLPAWSPSGGQIAYTSYMRNNPDLYVGPAGGGRPKRIASYRGMNTGASFSPDGSKIALTLSKDGNPDIYVISASDGKVLSRVTNDAAIDTSPAWSPDGGSIAFVSDRSGGPQIFVASAGGGGAKQVSFNGSYNTTPAWSPKKGARVLAYTTRADGHYDIVTLDLDSKKMVRITQGDGNNEEPSFSPNGRAIAFAKTGVGVFIANADGSGSAVKVYSGAATGIDWGPAPAQ